MAIGPPTGMRDWLPQDALLRQQLMETISSVYRLYGYLPIDTPVMEDLAVLLGKGGGENEKLLFKILKRGEKLAQAKDLRLTKEKSPRYSGATTSGRSGAPIARKKGASVSFTSVTSMWSAGLLLLMRSKSSRLRSGC